MTQDDVLPTHLGLEALEALGPPAPRPSCWRVRTEAGHLRLWTRWPTSTHVARAIHASWLTLDLPHIPRLLESDEAQCWTLHDQPEGKPLGQVLGERGLGSIEALGDSMSATLLQSLGRRMAEVHAQALPAHCVGELPRAYQTPPTRTLHSHLSRWLGQEEEAQQEALRLGAMALRHELRAFHPATTCVLTHGALSVWSVWVWEETMEVSALCGWGEARVLPRAAEFAHLVGIDQVFGTLGQRALRQLYGSYGMARTMDMERKERFFWRVLALEMLRGVREMPPHLTRPSLLAHLNP